MQNQILSYYTDSTENSQKKIIEFIFRGCHTLHMKKRNGINDGPDTLESIKLLTAHIVS